MHVIQSDHYLVMGEKINKRKRRRKKKNKIVQIGIWGSFFFFWIICFHDCYDSRNKNYRATRLTCDIKVIQKCWNPTWKPKKYSSKVCIDMCMYVTVMSIYIILIYAYFCFTYISFVGKLRTRHLTDYSHNNNANAAFLEHRTVFTKAIKKLLCGYGTNEIWVILFRFVSCS